MQQALVLTLRKNVRIVSANQVVNATVKIATARIANVMDVVTSTMRITDIITMHMATNTIITDTTLMGIITISTTDIMDITLMDTITTSTILTNTHHHKNNSMNRLYYKHKSTGWLWFDPGKGKKYFEPGWALVRCDQGIIDLYSWLSLKYGIEILKGSRWGSHISFIKDEQPTTAYQWAWREHARQKQKVTFHYATTVRYDNGFHAWVDVWCPTLHAIRAELGLPQKTKMNFHLTLGRLKYERMP